MSQLRVAIITGAGQGIGAGVARSFAAAGYHVSLMSPSDRSARLAAELGGIGRRGSVLDPTDVAALVDSTQATYGRIHDLFETLSATPGPVEAGRQYCPAERLDWRLSARIRHRCTRGRPWVSAAKIAG